MTKSFITQRFKEDIVPDEIKLLEAFFRATNLIPKDYALAKGLADLYILQLGGFYDPKGKFFAMADWQSVLPDEIVLSHELTHALQDQHFNLESFMDGKAMTLDEEQARQALVEGDATLIMTDFTRQQMAQPSLSQEDNVESLAMQMGTAAAFEQRAPQALVKMLAFPYSSGARFDHALIRAGKSGYGALDLAFKNPPRSTREILHPEVFIRGEKRVEIVDEDTQRSCIKDAIGEFMMGLILYQNKIKNFSEIAKELRADRVYLCGEVLTWRSVWSSEGAAKRFAQELSHNQKLHLSARSTGATVEVIFQ